MGPPEPAAGPPPPAAGPPEPEAPAPPAAGAPEPEAPLFLGLAGGGRHGERDSLRIDTISGLDEFDLDPDLDLDLASGSIGGLLGGPCGTSRNQTGYRWQEPNPTPYLTGPILYYPVLRILSDPILGTVRIPHREWHWRNHLPLKLGRPEDSVLAGRRAHDLAGRRKHSLEPCSCCARHVDSATERPRVIPLGLVPAHVPPKGGSHFPCHAIGCYWLPCEYLRGILSLE